jgi:hypothetical protein
MRNFLYVNFTVVPVDLVFKYRITVVGGGTRQSHPVLNHPWDMGIRVAIVNTGDIFICKTCGLPIRNLSKAKTLVEESLPCQSCTVCSNASEAEMKRVQRDIHTMLSELVEEVYRDRHNGQQPTEDFKLLVKNKLQKETNPAEKKIDKIREAILAKDCSDDDLIRQVAASERALAGFFYISGTRKALINSPTVLRHWVALAQKIQVLDKDCKAPEKVFTKLGTSRYDLNLVRWSKLTGDNPVSIIRDPNYYKRQLHPDDRTRAKQLERHIK